VLDLAYSVSGEERGLERSSVPLAGVSVRHVAGLEAVICAK
jgi:hypothetical protein